MDRGRIVEMGDHAELLARDGVYRKIYDLQLRPQESETAPLEGVPAAGGGA